MSTPSIIQQVIKYCDMGFFPVCKLQNGQYQTFSPFKDDDNNYSCSFNSYNLETAKRAVTEGWVDFNNIGEKHIPTEIIGFYHPGFKPFEVGDKVVVRSYNEIVTIKAINSDATYDIGYHPKLISTLSHFELEPYLEKSPVESKPLELTLEDIAQKFGVEKISIISNKSSI